MLNKIKVVKNWWLLTILGILITILGIWVYINPVKNYIALSISFSIIIFVSGIFEIAFALSNSKIIKGWGWLFSSGIFDLVIGLILISRKNITMSVLPIILGIWLIFKGSSLIGKGFLLYKYKFPKWGWTILGGILVTIFGFLVIYNPAFGSLSIVVWTALSLIILGIFTIFFSFVVKKLQAY